MQQDTVGPLNERQQKYLETVKTNSFQLRDLIDDLLDISRIESGSLELTFEEIDTKHEIENVVSSMRDEIDGSGIHVVLDIPSGLSRAKADRLRFSQVVTNLLSNACKLLSRGDSRDHHGQSGGWTDTNRGLRYGCRNFQGRPVEALHQVLPRRQLLDS